MLAALGWFPYGQSDVTGRSAHLGLRIFALNGHHNAAAPPRLVVTSSDYWCMPEHRGVDDRLSEIRTGRGDPSSCLSG